MKNFIIKTIAQVSLILLLLSCSVFAQQSGGSNYPTGNGIRVKEVDSAPNAVGITTLVFPNGSLTRAGQTMTVTFGGAATGVTIGTTTIISGTAGRVLYETSGNVLGEISGLTSNGSSTLVQTSTSATAFESGPNGSTNPVFRLVNDTASAATGISITGAAAGSGVAITALSSGANESINLIAKGSGRINTRGTYNTLSLALQSIGGAETTGFGPGGSNAFIIITNSANVASFNTSNFVMVSGGTVGFSSSSSNPLIASDVILRRAAAANFAFGAADVNGSAVAQIRSVQNAITGTNLAGAATTTEIASLGTSQGVPGRYHIQTGGLIAASGTTAHTAVDRLILGATKVLANNTTTTVTNVTVASNTAAAGFVEYAVEVFDGTDLQVETGSFTYQVTNKGGTIANNTITQAGASGVGVTSNFPVNTKTSGTLAVTWAISAANPALLSVNANSSLTPSTGYPRVTYIVKNLTQQAVAVQ